MSFSPIMFTYFDGCEYNKEKGAFKGGSECINGEEIELKFRFLGKRGLGLRVVSVNNGLAPPLQSTFEMIIPGDRSGLLGREAPSRMRT